MKKFSKMSYMYTVVLSLVLVLTGCTNNNNEESSSVTPTASATNQQEVKEDDEVADTDDNSDSEADSESTAADKSEENSTDASETEKLKHSSEETNTNENSTNTYSKDEPLAEYSSEEIEYARVWLQLGPNQQIDGLYVRHIPAGTTLEPDHFPIVSYPEDVVQLSGSRIVDGSVTYSSNGDGTINVYNVPLPGRWYGGSPTPPEGLDEETMREELEDIINNTELVYINPGNDDAVKKIIELISE
ncbi:hypothetical protein SAMN04489762_0742 [Terribacillus saccharophilus]|uniref:Lipoprotein n=1 Tax=Terribacillus saccharophilus TaxID=361277 RepID=A0AAX2ECA8_9BACI|nr:hypothetical protein SAMN04489762_0742 [Terribacillus saccharophilus]